MKRKRQIKGGSREERIGSRVESEKWQRNKEIKTKISLKREMTD